MVVNHFTIGERRNAKTILSNKITNNRIVLQGDSGGLRLGWVDLDLGSSPPLVGRYCSYLLPKQDGGTSQI